MIEFQVGEIIILPPAEQRPINDWVDKQVNEDFFETQSLIRGNRQADMRSSVRGFLSSTPARGRPMGCKVWNTQAHEWTAPFLMDRRLVSGMA